MNPTLFPHMLRWTSAAAAALSTLSAATAEPPDTQPDRHENANTPINIETEAAEETDAQGTPPADLAIELSPAVTRLLEGPVLSDPQRRSRRLYHGQWDALDLAKLNPGQLARWHAMQGLPSVQTALDDPAALYWNAQAHLRRGDLDAARKLADLLPDPHADADIPALAITLLRAQIDEAQARFDDAAQRLRPIRERFQHERTGSTAELAAAAQAILLLARLEGRPSADYHLALALLDNAAEQSPLAWEPRVVQARLLFDKDNPDDAADLVNETLALNPRCVPAWELTAQLALAHWDFAAALEVIEHLRTLAPHHPAVEELAVRRALRAADLQAADAAVAAMQEDRPDAPATLAWQAATAARRLNPDAAKSALARLDEITPRHPLGPFTVAQTLATARLYTDAQTYFRQAIARQPNDAAPRLALGLMLMQVGDLPAARKELADAARLDPFHAGVNNSLDLVQNMLDWPTIQTENFLIRYTPGPDAALARDLPPVLEKIRAELHDVFGQATDTLTQIELLPDAETFAVRITGESELGALAACTGDVLAMAPPRLGAAQTGVYHWANVLRHEYIHAIIFDLGGQLAPRWFHEGTATYFEELQRSFDHQQQLAHATNHNQLIPFDELPAAFMSPRIGFAYQQSGWMIEYIVTRWGPDALLEMMRVYARAGNDAQALHAATGLTSEYFMQGFTRWANTQVRAWGLQTIDTPQDLADALELPPQSLPQKTLDALQQSAPHHPDLLRLLAQRALAAGDEDHATYALTRYAIARPADPWPQRHLAAIALRRGDSTTAHGVLEWLDQRDLRDPQWALALANLNERDGHLDAAYHALQRALFREPYNASLRERAATLALHAKNYDRAAYQIQALIDLEPNHPQHPRRLNAIQKLIDTPPE